MVTGNPCSPSADSQQSSVGKLGVPVIPPAEDVANTTHTRKTKAKAKHQGRQQLRSK